MAVNANWGTVGVARSDNSSTTSISGAAYTSYASGSTTNSYIPILFAKKMLRLFYATSCYEEISNTEYSGMISKVGDQVVIRRAPDMQVRDYSVGQVITYDVPTSGEVTLNIDQAKYWGYMIADVDQLQSDLDLLGEFAANAAQKLMVTIDANVLSHYVANVDSDNTGDASGLAGAISGTVEIGSTATGAAGTPMEITGGSTGNAVQHIINANLILDEQNIEDNNRFIIVPSWFCAYLKAGDLRRADITGDGSGVIRSGMLGMVDRTKLIRSNNIPSGAATGGPGTAGEYWTLFGTKEACTFAMQLTKSESLRIPTAFGEYHRGLTVFGREVVQPKCLGAGVITQG